MLDVSYVRFVTKVSAWNRTIYTAFAASNFMVSAAPRGRLFMTASQSLYAIYVETQGAQMP